MSSDTIQNFWDIKLIDKNPAYPCIVIDNWFNPNEEKAVWKELDFYSALPIENIKRAENTIVARYGDGSSKSKAYRFYIEDYYRKDGISHIKNCMYKQRSPEFHKIIEQCTPQCRSFLSSNNDSTLISYYEENDHYAPHHDTFAWTCLIWMVREPILFEGGDFKLNETDTEIKLKNNRLVIFPSCLLHSVTPLKFKKPPPKEIGYGRYTITHFYYGEPRG